MSSGTVNCAAVLFDLDGTLADTAPDMIAALNRLCAEMGTREISFAHARPHVSHGSRALVKLGFPDADSDQVDLLIDRFLEAYARQLSEGTRLFAGMEEVLQSIEQSGRHWGIVTNKPARFTVPLIEALGLNKRAACVVSGDTVARSKPHAMPLLYACEVLALPPTHCLYVGDAERDIIAGRAAGMCTVAALYGYILTDDDPASWQADGMIEHPREILDWLEHKTRTDEHDAKLAR